MRPSNPDARAAFYGLADSDWSKPFADLLTEAAGRARTSLYDFVYLAVRGRMFAEFRITAPPAFRVPSMAYSVSRLYKLPLVPERAARALVFGRKVLPFSPVACGLAGENMYDSTEVLTAVMEFVPAVKPVKARGTPGKGKKAKPDGTKADTLEPVLPLTF